MADTDKCGHEKCNCFVDEDQDFCSPHCEAADGQDLTELKCDCGHTACN